MATNSLEGCGPKALLMPVSRVFKTRGNTWLFLTVKVFMLEMKKFYINVVMYIKICAYVYKAKNNSDF